MFGVPRWRSRIPAQIFATLVAIIFFFPLTAMIGVSLQGEGFATNYWAVLTRTPFFRFGLNSLIIAGGGIVLVYLCTMLASYVLAKFDFPLKRILYYSILAGLVLPSTALVVPLFIAVQRLNLFNNYLAVIVPLTALSIPFMVLLTRNYIEGIPNEILEAARIDGCGTFKSLIFIIMPLARPITVVLIVLVFLGGWNEFLLPLLFFQSEDMQVVTQVPLYFASQYASDTPKIFAALVMISVPVVALYLALQRLFESGLTSGAVK